MSGYYLGHTLDGLDRWTLVEHWEPFVMCTLNYLGDVDARVHSTAEEARAARNVFTGT